MKALLLAPRAETLVLRAIGGVVAGLVAWTAVATLVNLGMRLTWQEYASVEESLAFRLPMMLALLLLGALATLAGGYAAALLSRKATGLHRRKA